MYYSIKYKNFLPKDSGLLKYNFESPVDKPMRRQLFLKKNCHSG